MIVKQKSLQELGKLFYNLRTGQESKWKEHVKGYVLSTCHVILEQDLYDDLLDKMEGAALGEDEEDMLDMAFGLEQTSRLGCQITITEGMDGAVITLPKATRNFYVDGHKPTPH